LTRVSDRWRDGLAVRCLRRHGRADADDVVVRQADPAPYGSGPSEALDPDIVPFLTEDDPLGVDECATHRLPLADAAAAYGMFQRKADGAVKIMLKLWS